MSIFGIFSDKEKAEQRKKSLDESYDLWIEETALDENCEINLGGYIEQYRTTRNEEK